MTQRRRSAPRAVRRRTSRKVWITTVVQNALQVVAATNVIDLMTIAPDFMTFDTTILRVEIPFLEMHFSIGTGLGFRGVYWGLLVAPKTMDFDDFQNVGTTHIGPPYLHVGAVGLEIPAGQPAGTIQNLLLSDTRNPVQVKTKRRFRENDSTLWLIMRNVSVSGDTDITAEGLFRILLNIP